MNHLSMQQYANDKISDARKQADIFRQVNTAMTTDRENHKASNKIADFLKNRFQSIAPISLSKRREVVKSES